MAGSWILKADPAKLVARYFDAHQYFSNWGTHQFMLRLPKARIDLKALKVYFVGRHAARLTVVGEHVILDLTSDTEEPDDEELQGSLAALSLLRAELIQGDLRGAYLAWLLAVQAGEVGDRAAEPPLPMGLGSLTSAQQAMVEFLRIDVDLLAVAAGESAEPAERDDDLRRWVTRLPLAQKDQWLLRSVEDPGLALGGELLRAFRATRGTGAATTRRTAGALRALADTQQEERANAEAARATQARVAAEKQRQRRLDKLARNVDAAWAKLEALVAESDDDVATALAVDLKDLAARGGDAEAFTKQFDAMRKRQPRRRGFFNQWKRRSEGARW